MRTSRTFAFLLFLALFAGLCFGQTQAARLQGIVHDASGAIVPNAKVIVINSQTKDASDATTNASGLYVLAALRPGTYTLTVEAPGFSKTTVTDIELAVSASIAQDVKLEVGKLTEVIEVAANAVTVATTDAQVSAAVTMRDIDTLPQLARTPLTLAIFQPGVQISQNGSNTGTDTSYSHVNGLRQGSNNSTLDGIDVNDATAPRLGLSLTANNTDSVEEFRVVTASGKAEYGRNAGGQVELITRSGTNTPHGSLLDYIRNQAVNANDFFSNKAGVAKPMFIQNIFGGSFGGPVKRNKLFIFGNYQGRRTHQAISRVRTVPTDDAKKGLFKYTIGGVLQAPYDVLAADPLHKGIDPTIATLLKNYPSPNDNTVGDGLNYAGYRFNNPNNSLEDQFTIKADYNLKDNHHVFFRQSWQRNSSIDSLNNTDANFPGQPQGTQGGKRWGVAAGWDWTITPTTINEARYGHQSATTNFLRPARVAGPMYTFNNWTAPILTSFGQARNSPVNEYTDNLTRIYHNHTFKMGGNVRYTKQFGTNDANIYPTESLAIGLSGNAPPTGANPPGVTGTALTVFQGLYNNLLGRVGNITQTYYSDLNTWQAAGTPRVRNFVFHEYGFFLQDDWKVSRRLTLNLGLRYDFSAVPSELDGLAGSLDQAASINTVSQIDNFTIKKGAPWFKNDWNNFAPRIGFAWDPNGDGKTAIRGNYGIFYDRVIGSAASSVDSSTPGFASALTAFPSLGGVDVRISDKPAPPPQPAAPVLKPDTSRSISAISIFDPNLRTGYVQQWGLNVQRSLLKDTVLSVGYVGNRGLKLFFNQDLDQARYTPGFVNDVKEIANNLTSLGNVSPSNSLVKIFGTASAAVSALNSSNFQTNQLRNITDALDRTNNTRYAAAGLSQFYMRNYPQFFQLYYGTNAGLSWYNSLQVSLRHQTKSLRIFANYTFSKSLDNTNAEGNGSTDSIDNFNLGLNKGRSDFDRAHVFNLQSSYTLPVGKGHAIGGNMPRWANTLIGGWDIGGLGIWESGAALTATTNPGRYTATSYNTASWYNYSGVRDIGNVQRKVDGYDGIYYFDPNTDFAKFSYPGMGDYGNAGRGTFRGPRFFNIDASLVKSFALTERKRVVFRAEAYNLINNVNFALTAASFDLTSRATFGKISGVASNPRLLQGALRFEW